MAINLHREEHELKRSNGIPLAELMDFLSDLVRRDPGFDPRNWRLRVEQTLGQKLKRITIIRKSDEELEAEYRSQLSEEEQEPVAPMGSESQTAVDYNPGMEQ